VSDLLVHDHHQGLVVLSLNLDLLLNGLVGGTLLFGKFSELKVARKD